MNLPSPRSRQFRQGPEPDGACHSHVQTGVIARGIDPVRLSENIRKQHPAPTSLTTSRSHGCGLRVCSAASYPWIDSKPRLKRASSKGFKSIERPPPRRRRTHTRVGRSQKMMAGAVRPPKTARDVKAPAFGNMHVEETPGRASISDSSMASNPDWHSPRIDVTDPRTQ